ncbi:MAG TPA: hypothetical protein VGO37_01795 [Steroidobacteraceae bacterium]|jgi:cobalamin biosynthesis protein CbiG|nr:hypothetical protein [Steroidobacteraceae bacterium]
MSSDAVIPYLAGLSGTHMIAVEHAELVVALYAAMTALDANGLHMEASAARAVLDVMAKRAVAVGGPMINDRCHGST